MVHLLTRLLRNIKGRKEASPHGEWITSETLFSTLLSRAFHVVLSPELGLTLHSPHQSLLPENLHTAAFPSTLPLKYMQIPFLLCCLQYSVLFQHHKKPMNQAGEERILWGNRVWRVITAYTYNLIPFYFHVYYS